MTQNKLVIRPALPEDAAGIAALEKQCFSAPWSEQAVAAELAADGAVFLTAWCGAALAGYAGYRAVCGEGYLGNVAVAPALRRRGVGRTLMEALILQAERQNLAFLTLEVRRSNHAAIALYSGLGFRQAGVRPGYYTAPKEDALLLTLYFNGEEGNG